MASPCERDPERSDRNGPQKKSGEAAARLCEESSWWFGMAVLGCTTGSEDVAPWPEAKEGRRRGGGGRLRYSRRVKENEARPNCALLEISVIQTAASSYGQASCKLSGDPRSAVLLILRLCDTQLTHGLVLCQLGRSLPCCCNRVMRDCNPNSAIVGG